MLLIPVRMSYMNSCWLYCCGFREAWGGLRS